MCTAIFGKSNSTSSSTSLNRDPSPNSVTQAIQHHFNDICAQTAVVSNNTYNVRFLPDDYGLKILNLTTQLADFSEVEPLSLSLGLTDRELIILRDIVDQRGFNASDGFSILAWDISENVTSWFHHCNLTNETAPNTEFENQFHKLLGSFFLRGLNSLILMDFLRETKNQEIPQIYFHQRKSPESLYTDSRQCTAEESALCFEDISKVLNKYHSKLTKSEEMLKVKLEQIQCKLAILCKLLRHPQSLYILYTINCDSLKTALPPSLPTSPPSQRTSRKILANLVSYTTFLMRSINGTYRDPALRCDFDTLVNTLQDFQSFHDNNVVVKKLISTLALYPNSQHLQYSRELEQLEKERVAHIKALFVEIFNMMDKLISSRVMMIDQVMKGTLTYTDCCTRQGIKVNTDLTRDEFAATLYNSMIHGVLMHDFIKKALYFLEQDILNEPFKDIEKVILRFNTIMSLFYKSNERYFKKTETHLPLRSKLPSSLESAMLSSEESLLVEQILEYTSHVVTVCLPNHPTIKNLYNDWLELQQKTTMYTYIQFWQKTASILPSSPSIDAELSHRCSTLKFMIKKFLSKRSPAEQYEWRQFFDVGIQEQAMLLIFWQIINHDCRCLAQLHYVENADEELYSDACVDFFSLISDLNLDIDAVEMNPTIAVDAQATSASPNTSIGSKHEDSTSSSIPKTSVVSRSVTTPKISAQPKSSTPVKKSPTDASSAAKTTDYSSQSSSSSSSSTQPLPEPMEWIKLRRGDNRRKLMKFLSQHIQSMRQTRGGSSHVTVMDEKENPITTLLQGSGRKHYKPGTLGKIERAFNNRIHSSSSSTSSRS